MKEFEVTCKGKQYIIVRVSNELLALDINCIDSILMKQNITRMPGAQYFYKGVINLRGEIVPMISMRLRMGIEETEDTHKTRFVIVKTSDGSFVGLIVDEVREVIELRDEDIDKVHNAEANNYSIGIGKYGSELITLISIDRMIEGN